MSTLEKLRLKDDLILELLKMTRTTELLNYWNDVHANTTETGQKGKRIRTDIERQALSFVFDELERRYPDVIQLYRDYDYYWDDLSFLIC